MTETLEPDNNRADLMREARERALLALERSRLTMLDPTRLDPPTLLGRPELPLDWTAAKRELAGARVLVTGAGGSVGSRLAETLLDLGPAHLTLLDHHDHALFGLRRRLDDLTRERPRTRPSWSLALADIRDRGRMQRVLDEARPDVIFHMAAYKHVPFGEEFPEETFAVNVLATDQLLRLAAERGITRLVYPSSDKAVHPPSLYGATKRLSETLVGRFAHDLERRFVAVRYVNILGTHGSAIETFAAQVAGRPGAHDHRRGDDAVLGQHAGGDLAGGAGGGHRDAGLGADARRDRRGADR